MSISPAAALIDVALATRARAALDAEARQAQDRQADAIRAALDVGASVAAISEAAGGLTASRIYQIRDGTR